MISRRTPERVVLVVSTALVTATLFVFAPVLLQMVDRSTGWRTTSAIAHYFDVYDCSPSHAESYDHFYFADTYTPATDALKAQAAAAEQLALSGVIGELRSKTYSELTVLQGYGLTVCAQIDCEDLPAEKVAPFVESTLRDQAHNDSVAALRKGDSANAIAIGSFSVALLALLWTVFSFVLRRSERA